MRDTQMPGILCPVIGRWKGGIIRVLLWRTVVRRVGVLSICFLSEYVAGGLVQDTADAIGGEHGSEALGTGEGVGRVLLWNDFVQIFRRDDR